MNKFCDIKNKICNMSPTAKSAFVYTFAGLFTRGLSIITVPIFTRIMTTSEIGTINIYNSWYAMLSVISVLSLTSGGFMVGLKEFPDERNQYTSSLLFLTSLMACLLTVIYIVNPRFWNSYFQLPTELVVLMLVGLYVAPARDFWLSRQRYEVKYKSVAVVTIGTAIFGSAASILFVIVANNNGWQGVDVIRLFANYAVVYGVAAVLFVLIFFKGRTLINKKYWIFSLKLSIPLIGYSLASQVLNVSDRTMIDKLVGKHAVGIYGTLNNVSALSTIVWQALNSSFIPYMFSNMESEEGRKNIRKYINFILGGYAIVAFLMTLMSPEIVRILSTNEYFEAIYIMPPMAAGMFLNSLGNIYSNVLLYYKKTQYIMIATATAAVINIALNAVMIPIYGYQAAAYTTLIAHIVMALIQAIVSIRVEKKSNRGYAGSLYNNSILFAISAGLIVLCLICNLFYTHTVLRWGLVILGAVLMYAFRDKIKKFYLVLKGK